MTELSVTTITLGILRQSGLPSPASDVLFAQIQARVELRNLVDLVGIEPTTSSMPWNHQGGQPLILKQLMAG